MAETLDAVSLPSIHSWILKVLEKNAPFFVEQSFTPLDPLVDTESGDTNESATGG